MSVNKIPNQSSLTLNTLYYGSVGYMGAWALTNVNPLVGFAFGASYSLAGSVVDHKVKNPMAGVAVKIAIASAVAISVLAAILTVSATISLLSGVVFLAAATGSVMHACILTGYCTQKDIDNAMARLAKKFNLLPAGNQ